MARTTTISAVHEDDSRSFLDCVGLLAQFDNGTLRCFVCERPLREAGLGAVRKGGDDLHFACARLDCVRR